MKQNVGNIDKVVRILFALVLFSLHFMLHGNLRWLGLIGRVPLLTALVGIYPLYSRFGLNTCPIQRKKG